MKACTKPLKAGTHEGACSRSTLPEQSSLVCTNDFWRKNMLRNKTFAPEFCSLISNWFDMREQAPGSNLLNVSVSWASSFVCTEICFAGACLRSKLPRVYWNLLCGSVFQEQAPSCVLVGVLTRERFSGACFRSKLLRVYWLEYLPGSVFRERVSGASSLVCTGLYCLWNANYDRKNNGSANALRPRRFKWCNFSTNVIWYCSICLTLSTCQVFPSITSIKYASSYREMRMSGLIARLISTRKGMNGGKIGPSHLVSEHGGLSFLLGFFETVLGREHLGNVLFLRNRLNM